MPLVYGGTFIELEEEFSESESDSESSSEEELEDNEAFENGPISPRIRFEDSHDIADPNYIPKLHRRDFDYRNYTKSYAGQRFFSGRRAARAIPTRNQRTALARGDGWIGEPGDHIGWRFEILNKAGSGSFGNVYKCLDHGPYDAEDPGRPKIVAVKVERGTETNLGGRDFKTTEVRVMEYLKRNMHAEPYHIVRLWEWFMFKGHLVMVLDYLEEQVLSWAQLKPYPFQKRGPAYDLSMKTVRFLTKQLIEAMLHLKNLRLLNRDMKPDNLMLEFDPKEKQPLHIKIIDFGLAALEHLTRPGHFCGTAIYRPPELYRPRHPRWAYPQKRESYSGDMWALGCIVYELFTGLYFFWPSGLPANAPKPGDERLLALLHRFGKTRPNEMAQWPSLGHYFRVKEHLKLRTGCENRAFLDFLEKCFQWDPAMRLTPEQALRHPFLRDVNSYEDEVLFWSDPDHGGADDDDSEDSSENSDPGSGDSPPPGDDDRPGSWDPPPYISDDVDDELNSEEEDHVNLVPLPPSNRSRWVKSEPRSTNVRMSQIPKVSGTNRFIPPEPESGDDVAMVDIPSYREPEGTVRTVKQETPSGNVRMSDIPAFESSNRPASNRPASNRPASNRPASNKPPTHSTKPPSTTTLSPLSSRNHSTSNPAPDTEMSNPDVEMTTTSSSSEGRHSEYVDDPEDISMDDADNDSEEAVTDAYDLFDFGHPLPVLQRFRPVPARVNRG